MDEILRHLPGGAHVLDLGSGGGSFDPHPYPVFTAPADRQLPAAAPRNFVQADAANLPFRSGSFDAVICNHGLEHFEQLQRSLAEIGRVVKRHGILYLSVPDSTTVTDRLYRWLARGGGHVNFFPSPQDLAARVQEATQLPHVATRPLFTSLSFLNPANRRHRAPRKLLLLGGGRESVLLLLNYLFRTSDRFFGTRLSLYGWALFFGTLQQITTDPWVNVCVRCGAGHPAAWLVSSGAVYSGLFRLRFYSCPRCGTRNVFFRPSTRGPGAWTRR